MLGRRIGVFFAALLALHAVPRTLSAESVDACRDLLKYFYSTPGWHHAGVCGTNVYHVLKEFQRRGISLEDYDVVFAKGSVKRVGYNGPPYLGWIDVNDARTGHPSFRHHFFIVNRHTGVVLDLDFRSADPTHITAYAEAMYGRDQLSGIRVKRLGAQQYVDLVNHFGAQDPARMEPVMRTVRGETPQWPETSLLDVVNQFGG